MVQEDQEHPGLLWVQCPECREIKPIEAAGTSGTDKDGGRLQRVVRHYRAGERFSTGEWLYHPEWKDTGQVVEKCLSTGGHEIIVVSFNKLGTKRLVSNYAR